MATFRVVTINRVEFGLHMYIDRGSSKEGRAVGQIQCVHFLGYSLMPRMGHGFGSTANHTKPHIFL